jgi:hypothetical protein
MPQARTKSSEGARRSASGRLVLAGALVVLALAGVALTRRRVPTIRR